MTLTFHALWMLCGLGTAVLATAVRNWLGGGVLALGFGGTAAWTIQSGRLVDASWIGCGVARVAVPVVAGLLIWRRRHRNR